MSWRWILFEVLALSLAQRIIEWFNYGLEDGFFIDFRNHFYSWHVEINYSSLISEHSPPHQHRRWVVTSWKSRTFALASCLLSCLSTHLVLLIEFLFYGKNFLIREQDVLNKFLRKHATAFSIFWVVGALSKHWRGVWCTFYKLGDPSLLGEHTKQFSTPHSSLRKGCFAYDKSANNLSM